MAGKHFSPVKMLFELLSIYRGNWEIIAKSIFMIFVWYGVTLNFLLFMGVVSACIYLLYSYRYINVNILW